MREEEDGVNKKLTKQSEPLKWLKIGIQVALLNNKQTIWFQKIQVALLNKEQTTWFQEIQFVFLFNEWAMYKQKNKPTTFNIT